MKDHPKRYTHKTKIQTLRILEKNDFVLLKTEKLTGIRRQTIKVWAAELGPKVFSGKSPMEEALELVDEELKIADANIIRGYYLIRKKGLIRLINVIDNESRPEKLVEVLKFINEELQKMTDIEKDAPKLNLFQSLNDKLIKEGYEGEKYPESDIYQWG